MKKIISSVIVSVLSVWAFPFVSANAVYIDFPVSVETLKTENEDDTNDYTKIDKLASELGADTDYLNIVNYPVNDTHPLNPYCFADYMNNASALEAMYSPATTFSMTVSKGVCSGITAIEVLSHNGCISLSDIQENADFLNEITYNEKTDRIIRDYQALQAYTEFSLYEKYLVSEYNYAEQVERLTKTAQKCMNENKYFYIAIRSQKMTHAVCGIGITTGNWTFDNINYDKCVLTLDSNAQTSDGNAVGFTHKGCIYINSDTCQTYIPGYKEILDETTVYTVIDDDTLLNYKGFLSPSDKISQETANEIKELRQILKNTSSSTAVYTVDKEGNLSDLNNNIMFGSIAGATNVVKADSFHIEMNNEKTSYPNLRYIDTERWIDLEFSNDKDYIYNAQIDFSDNRLKVINNNNDIISADFQIRLNDGSYGFAPYCWWIFAGEINDDIVAECKENGILLKSSNHISMNVSPYYYSLYENGKYDNFNNCIGSVHIDSDNNVLITVDENKNFQFFIDGNNDEIYDTPIHKGDVNFDGLTDASDASYILSVYALFSTAKYKPVGYSICDYNNDGSVDASDASDVLAEYAEMSTS